MATGDGVTMVNRTKVEIKDMQFIQFHPPLIGLDSGDTFLITEALKSSAE